MDERDTEAADDWMREHMPDPDHFSFEDNEEEGDTQKYFFLRHRDTCYLHAGLRNLRRCFSPVTYSRPRSEKQHNVFERQQLRNSQSDLMSRHGKAAVFWVVLRFLGVLIGMVRR